MSSETVSDERLAGLAQGSYVRTIDMTADTVFVSMADHLSILEALRELQSFRSKPVAGVEVEQQAWNCSEWPAWLFARVDAAIETSERLDMSTEQMIGYAILSALLPKATAPVVSEPDAYVDWKAQCIYSAENIKDPTGLQPVWYASPQPQPQPKAVTEEMVERACKAYAEADGSWGPDPEHMRAALEAAMKEA